VPAAVGSEQDGVNTLEKLEYPACRQSLFFFFSLCAFLSDVLRCAVDMGCFEGTLQMFKQAVANVRPGKYSANTRFSRCFVRVSVRKGVGGD
jgi:hypothetical protein